MTNTIAKITDKIVEVTGNQNTKAFIGKMIERTDTDEGILYVIEDTDYVFTPSEYKMFAEAGAIAASRPTTTRTTIKTIKMMKKDDEKTTNSKPKQNPTKSVSKTIKDTANAAARVAVSKIEKLSANESYTFGGEDLHTAIADSSFLKNYPNPSFKLDTPKHIGLLTKRDAMKEKATGFFDRIGKKSRDKLVTAMTNDN